jgi:hypothetical protein
MYAGMPIVQLQPLQQESDLPDISMLTYSNMRYQESTPGQVTAIAKYGVVKVLVPLKRLRVSHTVRKSNRARMLVNRVHSLLVWYAAV